MIKHIFFDLDDTIFDFHKAEQIALKSTLEHFGVPSNQEIIDLYHEINIAHWKRLEKGEITREQVKVGRYETLFKEIGVENVDAAETTLYYEQQLAIGHHFLDGSEEMIQKLYGKYHMYLVSNGSKLVQEGRLKSSGISKYFDNVFVSEVVGFEKPDIRFFETCFSQIKDFNKDEAVIIGDSLTSDIQGGKNANIKTIWFNAKNATNSSNICPDYEVSGPKQVISLLESLS